MDVLGTLAEAIDALPPPRALVAIDGPDAAGKTTLARRLADVVRRPAVLASIDGWHRPKQQRLRRGVDSPEGYYADSFDYSALVSELLDPFAGGATTVATAGYDYRNDVAAASYTTVGEDAVLLFDGVFLLRPGLRPRWDLAVYLHVSEDTTLSRALDRDRDQFGTEAAVISRYQRRYLPGQALYRQDADPLNAADIVLDNTDPAEPAVLRWRASG